MGDGLPYQDAVNKLKTYKSVENNPALQKSLLNQVKASSGEEAVKEAKKEFSNHKRQTSCSTDFINSKSMKIMGGIGDGHCNPSKGRRMKYIDGEWREI